VDAAEERVWLTTARLGQCGNEIVECISRDLNAAEMVSRQLYSTQQTPSQGFHTAEMITHSPETTNVSDTVASTITTPTVIDTPGTTTKITPLPAKKHECCESGGACASSHGRGRGAGSRAGRARGTSSHNSRPHLAAARATKLQRVYETTDDEPLKKTVTAPTSPPVSSRLRDTSRSGLRRTETRGAGVH